MIIKNVESLRVVFLGIQHAFTMFASVILVPKLLGIDVSVAIFMAGSETLIFHLLTKGKVPVFLGSSFEFLPPLLAASSIYGMEYALGGIVICGAVYAIVALMAFLFGTEKIIRLFPPVITGSISIAVGLSLASHAIKLASANWVLAVIAFLIIVWINVNCKGFAKILSIVISISACYLVSILLTKTGYMQAVDFSAITESKWFGIPKFSFAKFNIGAALIILLYTICAIVDHIGDIVVTGAICKKDFTAEPGIHKTLLADGIATSISATLGGAPNATYSENIGVLALTQNYNPKALRIAAIIAIILGFIPKVSAVIASIPDGIIGGVSIILFGTISAMGVSQFIEHKVDFTNSKNVIIVATILILSLGGAVISVNLRSITFSVEGIGLSAIVGVILNLILSKRN